MTNNEFHALCQRYTVDTALALENDSVVECLLEIRDSRDDNSKIGYRNCLIRILETEF